MAKDKNDLLSKALEGSKDALDKLIHSDLISKTEMNLIRVKGKTRDVRELAAKFLSTKTEQQKRRVRQMIMFIFFIGLIILGFKMFPKIESWFVRQTTPVEVKKTEIPSKTNESTKNVVTKKINSPKINKERFIEEGSIMEDSVRRVAELFASHYGIINCESFYFSSDKNKTEWVTGVFSYRGDTIKGGLSFIGFQGAIVIKLLRSKNNNFVGTWKMMNYESNLTGELSEKQLDLTFKGKTGGTARAVLHKIR